MINDTVEKVNTNQEAVNPITQGVIWKQLLLYFVPLLGASFLQLLYNTADTIIVGRFVGKTALSAVGGSAGQIYAMITEFMIGVSGGAGVILSQAYGARNRKLLDTGIHNAAALALALGTLFMTAGLIAAGPALQLAGAPVRVVFAVGDEKTDGGQDAFARLLDRAKEYPDIIHIKE